MGNCRYTPTSIIGTRRSVTYIKIKENVRNVQELGRRWSQQINSDNKHSTDGYAQEIYAQMSLRGWADGQNFVIGRAAHVRSSFARNIV